MKAPSKRSVKIPTRDAALQLLASVLCAVLSFALFLFVREAVEDKNRRITWK